ncbi:LOW QUALITY PROTEIN: chitin elicitor receptor kinase 1 [Beta vulgaris subsp. vulgaris]|uniref:LOW QUALITY PROTEIN: chitin elicitor receptor kinase 1 n=1 Tax=Beta vulgaris subsp. vulgaris TaxID=3555 RepID=UPI002546CFE7|nr:LOW QUALITY PROTEIN: chitin elicitor receptor kinase 1 [Beta vulgaris subsp. vulgaris]
MMKKLGFVFAVLLSYLVVEIESICSRGCDLALASYYVLPGGTISVIADYLDSSPADIVSYNPELPSADSVQDNTRINIPFSCDCIDGDFLGHVFSYRIQTDDTYVSIAGTRYANLTTPSWIESNNNYTPTNLPPGGDLNVTVNCSCGNSSVVIMVLLSSVLSPLRPGDSLSFVAQLTNVSASLLQRYNPGADFSAGNGLVFIPGRDRNGNHPPLTSGSSPGGSGSASSGVSPGAIAGICVAVGLSLLLVGWYLVYIRRKKKKETLLQPSQSEDVTGQSGGVTVNPKHPGVAVDKSVEFPYEELAHATDNFSLANKIGEGGFGAVYYGELRGEKAAVKKMDMQATREFLAELKVLTHVHHLNLVRLIGYCVEGSLFLVYEYIENGNLSQHLRGSGKAALPWHARVQIALDSARGLEYIHEHTVPVYIHRDIKSANILIDNNLHAKVADFGLTKLAEVGNASLPTRLVGTFGYMPPEYAQFGDVSPKVDVFAFGVVLFELVSGKEAVVKGNGSVLQPQGLATLFEDVLRQSDPSSISKLIDPRLGEEYPLDSVLKMVELARTCTQDNPELRPSMRSVVVALNSFSSTTETWDIGSFYEHGLKNLASGR